MSKIIIATGVVTSLILLSVVFALGYTTGYRNGAKTMYESMQSSNREQVLTYCSSQNESVIVCFGDNCGRYRSVK